MGSALLKLPLLLLEAYCVRIAVKSPTPHAARHEEAKYSEDGKSGDVFPLPNVLGPNSYRRVFYCIVLAEASAIVTSTFFPSLQIPQIFRANASINVTDIQPSLPFTIGLLLMCAGALIRASCYRHMGRLFTYELAIKDDHELITSGPYAIVRHPSYVGSCLFYPGACFSQLGRGSWLAESGLWRTSAGTAVAFIHIGYCFFICTFLVSRVPREDVMLRKEFKERWVEWARRHTPYRLVPYVY